MFARLPAEVTQEILSRVDDLNTLKSAALSCRAIYKVFTGAEDIITTRILLRQIHPTVLPDAIVVRVSRTLSGSKAEDLDTFSNSFLGVKKPPPSSWKLVDALPLSQFHGVVEPLTTRLSSLAFNRAPRRIRETPFQSPPTHTEVLRIQRALYRFQLYCNLFQNEVQDSSRQRGLFFSHFSVWENEQLACVHDLLIEIVAKPFNDMVDHDVQWSRPYVPYIIYPDSDQGEYILSQGLEYVLKLVNAQEYVERRRILSGDDITPGCDDDEPPVLSNFLHHHLSMVGSPSNHDAYVPFCELDKELKDSFVGKPFYDDPDPGPAAAWEWINGGRLPDRLVGTIATMDWRTWGYVFWGILRLESSGILQSDRYDSLVESNLIKLGEPERQQFLSNSREERMKIASTGGSGW
ncbi:hypothetical protein F5Y04DRAFT_290175 [Hypomontagnella monticulosa]|nr:hypothetical protein F5Y04DRAFT_290175 [Hypomontagnella monticulosa]